MPQKLSHEIITAAIAGFEAQKKHIDAQIAELRNILTGERTTDAVPAEAPPKRRKVSAASRRRMALGQKKRWAAVKGQSNSQATVERPRRRISEAGMKRIIAANKKRWALKRAEAAKANQSPAKKAVSNRKRVVAKKTTAA